MFSLVRTNFDRDFNHFFTDFDKAFAPLRKQPPELLAACDIHETETGFTLNFDMPGVAKEDINIECSDRQVTVSAERKQESTEKDSVAHRVERSYGLLKRSFILPEGLDADKVQANYENGVLYLSIPKLEAQKPKKVQIGLARPRSTKN